MGIVTAQIQSADGTIHELVMDRVGSNNYPIYKMAFGVLGTAGVVVSSASPMPVTSALGATAAKQLTDDFDTGAGTDTRRATGLVRAESGGATLIGSANPMPTWMMPLEIARGAISGMSFMHKFGANPDIDQTEEDIWGQGGTYTFMTSASTLYISSSNSGDDQIYKVLGLDANWDEQTVNVTANGNAFVALTGTWRRVFRVQNMGATNSAGDIYISDDNTDSGGDGIPDTASNIKAKVIAGDNQTLMCIYTIPNGKTGYLSSYFTGLIKKTSVSSVVTLKVREQGSVFQVKNRVVITSTGSSHFQHFFPIPDILPSKADILIAADSSANDVGVAGGFDIILVDD